MAIRGLPTISTGTVTATNGSTTVTGTSTSWLDSNNLPRTGIGALLCIGTLRPIVISQITAAGTLILQEPWPHTTQTNVAYTIVVPHPLLDAPLSRAISDLLARGTVDSPLSSEYFNTGSGYLRVIATGGRPGIEASPNGTNWYRALSFGTAGFPVLTNRTEIEKDVNPGTGNWWLRALGASEPNGLALGVSYTDAGIIQTVQFMTNGLSRFHINSSGQVGIKTTNQTHDFHLNGEFRIQGTGPSGEQGKIHAYWVSSSNRFTYTTNTAGDVIWESGVSSVTDRFKFMANGAVAIKPGGGASAYSLPGWFNVDTSGVAGWFGPSYNGGTAYNTGDTTLGVYSWTGIPRLRVSRHNVNTFDWAIGSSGELALLQGGSTEKVRFDANGNYLFIGRTSSTSGATRGIEVEASGAGQSAIIKAIGGSTSGVAGFDAATQTANAYITWRITDNSGSPYAVEGSGSAVTAKYYDFKQHRFRNWNGADVAYINSNTIVSALPATYDAGEVFGIRNPNYSGDTRCLAFGSIDSGAGAMDYIRSIRAISFAISNAEIMRINSAGLGIGAVTASNSVLTAYKSSADTWNVIDFGNVNTGNNAGVLMRLITNNAANSGTTSLDIYKQRTGTAIVRNNEGTLYLGGSGINCLELFSNGAQARMRVNLETQTTVGAAGAASAMPTPIAYMIVNVNGVDRKVALFNV